VIDVVAPHWVGLDIDSWGLDHGCWSVLAHMFPAADVPVVQLSVHAALDLEQHVQIGRSLAALADDGVLVVASGNVVHHLGKLDGSMGDRPFDWAERFDDAAGRVMTTDPASITSLAEHPDVADAVPTSDHFLPLAYLAGLADARGTTAQVWNRSFALGSLSMTSYRVD
jgi:4,5-DOPA dioxygenase extradiol